MPTGDLPGWRQVWAEDFNRSAAVGQARSVYADSLKFYDDGTTDTSRNAVYDTARTVSASNSALHVDLHTVDGVARGTAFAAQSWSGQVYGRYSVRFRSAPVAGYGEAFLLWPTSNVWNEGEIDFPEGGLDGTINGYVHEVGPNPGRNVFATNTGRTYTDWHVATTEWAPDRVTFYLDGVKVGETRDTAGIPRTPMRWTFQTGSHGSKPPSDARGTLSIDWATMYAYQP
jgi:beta-glucanase (GH16 family)